MKTRIKKSWTFLILLKVPYQVIGTYGDLEPLIQKNTIAVLRPFAHDSFGNNIYKEMKINILIFGKYPAIAVENKILESLSTHLPQARISFCLSLEEPFFKFLGADNIKSMMDTLGMKEDECIEHTMVSKAIKRAFEKIDKDLVVEIKARSEQAWFTKNLKQES